MDSQINPVIFLCMILIDASGVAFIFILFEKTGLIDLFQMYRSNVLPPFLRALPDCLFCMIFWLCVLISIPLVIENILYLALAPFSTPIAKAIYENCRATRK